MADDQPRIYWDACVFLTYVEHFPEERMPILDALVASALAKEIALYTSTVSIAEVAFATAERVGRVLDPDVEAKIDALWDDRAVVKLVDFHPLIGRQARELMRSALLAGRSVKPLDAIHLATAQRMVVAEFHTYDQRLLRFAASVNLDFPVLEPFARHPRLLP